MAEGRTIVIALDGSHHSDYAFDWYLKNGRKENDNVIIVTCFEKHGHHFFGHDKSHDEGSANLKKEIDSHKTLAEDFQENLLRKNGVQGEVVATAGKPGEVVVHVAEDKKATMIICGSRGHGALRRTIMGSISSYIVHHSHIPVIVCRHKSHHNPDNEHHN